MSIARPQSFATPDDIDFDALVGPEDHQGKHIKFRWEDLVDSLAAKKILSHRAWAVSRMISKHVNRQGICWPSIERMGTISNCSPKTVRRGIIELVDLGLLATTGNVGRAHEYKVLLDGARDLGKSDPNVEHLTPVNLTLPREICPDLGKFDPDLGKSVHVEGQISPLTDKEHPQNGSLGSRSQEEMSLKGSVLAALAPDSGSSHFISRQGEARKRQGKLH